MCAQALAEMARSMCSEVEWIGVGGPSDINGVANSKFGNSVLLSTLNVAAMTKMGSELKRIKGSAATKGPKGCSGWHVPNMVIAPAKAAAQSTAGSSASTAVPKRTHAKSSADPRILTTFASLVRSRRHTSNH